MTVHPVPFHRRVARLAAWVSWSLLAVLTIACSFPAPALSSSARWTGTSREELLTTLSDPASPVALRADYVVRGPGPKPAITFAGPAFGGRSEVKASISGTPPCVHVSVKIDGRSANAVPAAQQSLDAVRAFLDRSGLTDGTWSDVEEVGGSGGFLLFPVAFLLVPLGALIVVMLAIRSARRRAIRVRN